MASKHWGRDTFNNEYFDAYEFYIEARADLVAENERLKEQHEFIVRECEASSTQTARIVRIKKRAEAALAGRSPSFANAHDKRENKVKHIAQLTYMNDLCNRELTVICTVLVAVEARESATRAILDQVMDDICSEAFLFDGGNGISADTEDAADNLLAQPRDYSALREMIAEVYEECAKYFDGRADWEMFGDRVADDIRALAEKKLASLTF